MSKPNSKRPPVIHYGTAHPDPNPPPSQPTDSTMLLASVSEQYGSSIPPSRFARNKGENKTAVAPPPAAAAPAPTVDTKTAKYGSLPMFLTKTYHMIDATDSAIVTWSDKGDAFSIHDPDKFAADILPQYFKHSNFASFARQLNFYGFRKLKSDPILTSDFDAEKSPVVSFFHEKFQRGNPDLLADIKRTTKSDMSTTKSEAETLKEEIATLRAALNNATSYYNHRLLEITADYDARFNQLWNQLKHLLPNGSTPPMPLQFPHQTSNPSQSTTFPPVVHTNIPLQTNGLAVAPGYQQMQMQNQYVDPSGMTPQPVQTYPQPAAQMSQTPVFNQAPTPNSGYTMQSLSHVAGVKLQSPSVQPLLATLQPAALSLDKGTKRGADDPVVNIDKRSKTEVDGNDVVFEQPTDHSNI